MELVKSTDVEIFYEEDPWRIFYNGMPMKLYLNYYVGCQHGCKYCYIKNYANCFGYPHTRFIHERVVANVATPAIVDAFLSRREKEIVWIGSTTDPYQPIERELQLTKNTLKVFIKHEFPFMITTKSNLVTRDLDLLAEAADYCQVVFSISTLNNEKSQNVEANAAPVAHRIDALARMVEKGIDTRVFILPVIPGYTDDGEEIERLIELLSDIGVKNIFIGMLGLTDAISSALLPHLPPNARAKIENLYMDEGVLSNGKLYPSEEYTRDFLAIAKKIADKQGVGFICNIPEMISDKPEKIDKYKFPTKYFFQDYMEERGLDHLTVEEAIGITRQFVNDSRYEEVVAHHFGSLNESEA